MTRAGNSTPGFAPLSRGLGRHTRVCCALLCLMVLSATATAAHADNLVRVRSKHYTIHTTLTDGETLRTFGRHMDAIFAAYRHRFREYRPRHAGHMPLYLFETRQQYVDFLARHGIDAENSGGMFFVARDVRGLATWTRDRGRGDVFEVLQHEGFHQFAWNYLGPQLPQWVNEGLAQYFEDGVLVGPQIRTGLADARRIRIVKNAFHARRVMPVVDVLEITNRQWNQTLATDPVKAELLYAQAWSMVFFLIHGDNEKYQPHFARYLMLLSRGVDSPRAFRRAFGLDDLSPMQRRWAGFARAHEPDPVTLATERMGFLAAGLRWLHEHDRPLPETLDELKHTLRQSSFRLIRRTHEGRFELSADDPTNFGFEVKGHFKPFDLLEPAAAGLPPRIAAQGLDPEPTVQWRPAPDGGIVEVIEYR